MLTPAILAIVLMTAISAWAQNVAQNGRGRQNGLNLAAMANQIFDQSDRNHNNVLSRTEFSTAQLLTDNTVAQMGRSGLIGRGTTPVLARLPAGPLGQGGMLGQQGGLFNLQITNTNRVTLPQFTNYFQNAVARGDAAWRQMYAMNRNTNGRAYPRYGRGYGRSPYRNYGSGSYRPSVMAAGVCADPHKQRGPQSLNRRPRLDWHACCRSAGQHQFGGRDRLARRSEHSRDGQWRDHRARCVQFQSHHASSQNQFGHGQQRRDSQKPEHHALDFEQLRMSRLRAPRVKTPGHGSPPWPKHGPRFVAHRRRGAEEAVVDITEAEDFMAVEVGMAEVGMAEADTAGVGTVAAITAKPPAQNRAPR